MIEFGRVCTVKPIGPQDRVGKFVSARGDRQLGLRSPAARTPTAQAVAAVARRQRRRSPRSHILHLRKRETL